MNILLSQTGLVSLQINNVLGGFGLFILGITFLGDGLKEVAGPKIRDYIEKYTSNTVMAIIVGALITGLIQSSSAATVISISLVRAGLMSLKQAIGIAIGANIGTTITSIMVGLKIDQFGLYFVFVGAILFVAASRKRIKDIAFVLFAFGITFLGLTMMGEELALLQNYKIFNDFIEFMSLNPWLALIGGTFATAIINSSSAFIAIVQKIYAGGGIDLTVVVALVLGSNIGTTITAYLSSIGGTISAKRAALFHTLFNLAGAVIVMIFLGPYTKLVTVVGQSIGATSELQVAIAHLFFNLIFAIAVIPVLPYFMTLLEKLIPGADKQLPRTKLVELNDDIVHSFPEGAMSIAKQGIVQMGDLVLDSIINSQHFLNTEDANEAVMVHEMEETINIIDTQLTTYLLKIVKASPSEYIAEGYTQYLETIKNYERISDLTTNLADFYALIFENKEKLSPDALEDLNTMYTLLIDIIKRSNNIFKTEDTTQLKALFKDESYLDIIEGKYREKHFQRMAQGICTTKITASIYVDILSTLERMGDHGVNVARFVDSPIKQHSYKKIV